SIHDIVIGTEAMRGVSNLTKKNVILGDSAAFSQKSGSYNIAIGSNTQFSNVTGSNQLNIGNWIFGDNGKIGLGKAIPAARLHVINVASDLTPAIIEGCGNYANNAAAVTAGLPIGALYRNGDVLMIVH
ncbi:MAG: hypothetical protein JST36_03790, partial [Bacteroidetes bacterium]|nr:hypothetical protein [Bacteroidota bacterium]